MYNIIFIGTGISNLYLANKLKDSNYIILEKKGIIGGRIKTKKYDNFNYELGAYRIHENHKKVINLIKKINLENKLKKLSSNKDYIQLNENKTIKINNKILSNYKKSITNILKLNNKKNDTLYSLLLKKYSTDYINKLININGYNLIYKNMNYNDYKNNYYQKNDNYYYLEGGLSQIIDNLKNNLNIKLNSYVIEIMKKDNYYLIKTNEKTYKTKKIIFGIPKENLLKIKFLENYFPLFNSVTTNNFIRIYALYPKVNNSYWFDNINTTYSNSVLRKIIKDHNSKYGLIQICYNDGLDAKIIKNNIINKSLNKIIHQELERLFPNLAIPKPKKLFYQYWYAGTHYYKPCYNSKIIYKKLLNPQEDIYIVGECFSHCQGWMEGALQTADDVYNLITKNIKIKNEKIKTISKKVFDENSLKKNWTIYNDYVYDLSIMLKSHPGGEIIKYSIGKDMTNMFNGVGHSSQAYYLLEQYKIGKLI